MSLASPAKTATIAEEQATKSTKSSDILDLFTSTAAGGDSAVAVAPTNTSSSHNLTTTTKKNISDDLLSLNTSSDNTSAAATASNNPFADILSSMNNTMSPMATVSSSFGVHQVGGGDRGTNFATSDNFAAAFGTSSNSNIGNVLFLYLLYIFFTFSQIYLNIFINIFAIYNVYINSIETILTIII